MAHDCPRCGKAFTKKCHMERHIKNGSCQKETTKHSCPECSQKFNIMRQLMAHIMKDHSAQATHLIPDHKCTKCSKTFCNKKHLEEHTDKGSCVKQHKCTMCTKGYASNQALLRHMRMAHPKQAPAKKPHRLADVQGYNCSCGESFATGAEYRTHKDRVHVRKPGGNVQMTRFSCRYCDEKFDYRVEVIQHEKEHQGNDSDDDQPRYYKCPFKDCSQRFQNKEGLLKHKWIHRQPIIEDDQEPTSNCCDVCEEWFWYETELREHKIKEHDGAGPNQTVYQCPYIGCNETFSDMTDQRDHIEDHCTTEQEEPEEESASYGIIHDELMDPADLLSSASNSKALYTEVGDAIIDKAGQKKFKTVRTRQSFQLTPTGLRLCAQGFTLEVMSRVIESLFKGIVGKGGYIQIKVLSDSLDTPIVMPLIHVNLFDPLVLLNYIESVLSSKDQLALDETLTFDVIHVEDMNGSGKLNPLLLDSYLKRRTGVFDARNWDFRCLGLCLAASLMINKTNNFLQAKFYKEPQRCKKLQQLTDELYRQTGVDQDKECGEPELQKFQTLFETEYSKQLIVLDEKLEHQFTGQPARNENDQLFLLLFDKHYYLIWDLQAFIGSRKKYCQRCIAIYDSKRHHLCDDVCPQCYRANCEAMENPDTIIVCDRCNITFKNFQCFLAHAGSQRVCMHKRYRCATCLCIKHTNGRHDCTKKPKCQHCYEEVDLSEHLCQVQEPSERVRLGSKEFNVVYFDVETATCGGGRLVPYLVCWAINCEKCINIETENCKVCGHRYRFYYGWDCANKFGDWLSTNKRIEKHRTILTAHNSAKFDAYFIYEYAAATGSRPNLNFRANDLLSFTWKKIQLKDSFQFMKCPLDKLPSIMGLDNVEKGFFAWRLANRVPTLDYRGQIPPPYDFGVDRMSEEKQKSFWEFYTPLSNDPNYVYDLKEEALKYCRMDVKILEAAWKQFRQSCLTLTDGQVDPLIGRYFTLASFSAAIYKTLFMKHPIGIVPYGGYRNPKRGGQSWQGSAYLDFLNDQRVKNGQEPFVCANNAVEEFRIGPYKLDAYCRQTGAIEEILGCYWHAHTTSPSSCLWNLRKTVHPTRKPLTYEEVNLETATRIRRLRNTGRPVHCIWTCEIVRQMSANPLLSSFMKDGEMLRRYKKPLDPSLAVFGGRVEAFKTKMVLTFDQIMSGYTIEHIDFCSLYPFVQWWFEFTTKPHPTVIVERAELNRLLEHLREFVTFLSDNYGLCYCKVSPPRKLNFAVLPYRTRDKTVFPLCRKCAEEDTNEICDHGENDRALEGVYTFYELLKALQRGYRVMQIYEIWNYGPEKAKIMADYVTRMISLKTKHSKVPSDMTVQEFCDVWNEKVPGMDLKPEDMHESPAMRLSAKILMNSLWGKFCERASKTYTCLVDGWRSLQTKLNDKELVVSRIEQISGRSLVVSYQKKQPFLTETSMYNPVLGAHVTAYARITLLEKCLEVVGECACYVDTDSLVYLRIPGTPDPVRGEALGQLANELKSSEFGTCYQCIAPKTWRLEVSERTCEAPMAWRPSRAIIKAKGLHLMALGSSLKDAIDDRQLWNDLIDMRLVEEDGLTPRQSMKEFYKTLEGYRVPDELIKPCLDAFMQQKWVKSRSGQKASGLYVPQPKLTRNRFTAQLKEERLAKKIIRFRHDKSMLLNTEENWPQNRSATKPFGFNVI